MTERSVPIVWHVDYEVDIGPHVFPVQKYRCVHERLLGEGLIRAREALSPAPATDEEIGLVHTADYLDRIRRDALSVDEQIRLEVPYSTALRTSMWLCAGGTTLTGRLAMDAGVAVHLGGGFHHAFADHGEGFCLINDVAVAIRTLQRDGACARVAVLDCDVHHGNGTAAIFADDASVYTFSMHQERNYPYSKPPSDLDLGLPDGLGDDEYLALLEEHVPTVLAEHRPELVFYLAGADPYERDQLGGLGLTLDGLRRRDELVLRLAREASVPVAVTLAGGYALIPAETVTIHCATVRAAQSVFRQ